MKVLACAIGFGLGPSGKLSTIVNYNEQFEWYACGDKLDLSIYKKNPFIDCCWSKNEKDLENFVKKYLIKCAVNVLDQELAITLKKIGIEVIYVDSLPFMWTNSDIIPYDADYYCAQKYPNYFIRPVLEPVKNLIWVEPIIFEIAENKENTGIVINFGGLHSPFGEGREYFEVIMKALFPIISAQNIHITGGNNVVKLVKKLFPSLHCQTYSHEEFLKLVAGAELFITSPGLTTIYETCGMNIKTVVMPPQNLSQFYNVSIAEKVCKNVKVLSWKHDSLNFDSLKCFSDKSEEETVRYIYEQIRILSKDKKYIKNFRSYVLDMLKEDFSENATKCFEGNGVIEISKILCKISERKKRFKCLIFLKYSLVPNHIFSSRIYRFE